MAPPRNERVFEPNASIVLVGCRGAGKRTLGFMGALHLRRRLVTEDHYFEKITGLSRGQYLARHGRDHFARQNIEVFKRMLDTNRSGCIIECGMSSFSEEAQDALREYSRTNPVVYIHREKEQIARLMDPGDAQQLLEADSKHRNCSNFEYYNPLRLLPLLPLHRGPPSGTSTPMNGLQPGPSKLLSVQEGFAKFLDIITGRGATKAWLESPFSVAAVPPEFRSYSYSLRLRLSYLMDMDLEWEDFEARGDCVELIIDHWPDDLLNVVARQVALIRRKLGVPIIYHVEENPRGERRKASRRERCNGCGAARVSLGEPSHAAPGQIPRSSATIGTWGLGRSPWQDEQQMVNYRRAQALGCDVVRMVRFCANDSPVEYLDHFKKRLNNAIPDPKPPHRRLRLLRPRRAYPIANSHTWSGKAPGHGERA
ncbi:hypothetical protein CHGG_04789 [Chaetomium globosum CBS 148.51]|uniref:Shikimate kinase n=1 Tax=Chaetomium globosum (strain ATCC 6205 / CBS 148.51 / DSM 1962 / NBRC 6347 / NRRL 1970) TaxID=306901 RepID=Q2H0A7_CHAGB|nr:uncharacterized protein CHGG_04789 [Chaetomium globosum CBS 148.51]EAQ88170.1 hypothetical protein CHGG_04789 [Chaetomium globosum CBS 148.51]